MDQATKELNLVDIINITAKYKTAIEIQGVSACVEEDAKTVFLRFPYQAEDYIWCVFHITYPNMDSQSIETMAQEYLKKHEEVRDYLYGYLQSAMRDIR